MEFWCVFHFIKTLNVWGQVCARCELNVVLSLVQCSQQQISCKFHAPNANETTGSCHFKMIFTCPQARTEHACSQRNSIKFIRSFLTTTELFFFVPTLSAQIQILHVDTVYIIFPSVKCQRKVYKFVECMTIGIFCNKFLRKLRERERESLQSDPMSKLSKVSECKNCVLSCWSRRW